jgi:hypothetical protein
MKSQRARTTWRAGTSLQHQPLPNRSRSNPSSHAESSEQVAAARETHCSMERGLRRRPVALALKRCGPARGKARISHAHASWGPTPAMAHSFRAHAFRIDASRAASSWSARHSLRPIAVGRALDTHWSALKVPHSSPGRSSLPARSFHSLDQTRHYRRRDAAASAPASAQSDRRPIHSAKRNPFADGTRRSVASTTGSQISLRPGRCFRARRAPSPNVDRVGR